jgi:ABC-2 type transport system permease protein
MIERRSVLLVARRELRQQVASKAIWLSLAIGVVAICLLVVLPEALAGGPPTYRVAVTGQPDPAVRTSIAAAAATAGARVEIFAVPDRAAAETSLRAGDGDRHADIAVVQQGPGAVLVDRAFAAGSTQRKPRVVQAIAHDLAVLNAVRRSGLPTDQAAAAVNPAPLAVDHLRPTPGSDAGRLTAFAGSALFFLLVMRHGFALLTGVAQEKSTRVVELLLSTIRPVDLLGGKVLAAVGMVLVEAVLLTATALISAQAVGSEILHGGGVGLIVTEGIWVVLGLVLYAALFAAAGAMAVRTEEAQSVGMPLQIPLFLGYFASVSALGADHANTAVTVLAYVPFTAPMNMPMLSATGGAGAAAVAVSMVITALTAVGATWLAAVIFRRSILRTGQRTRFVALLREHRAARAA